MTFQFNVIFRYILLRANQSVNRFVILNFHVFARASWPDFDGSSLSFLSLSHVVSFTASCLTCESSVSLLFSNLFSTLFLFEGWLSQLLTSTLFLFYRRIHFLFISTMCSKFVWNHLLSTWRHKFWRSHSRTRIGWIQKLVTITSIAQKTISFNLEMVIPWIDISLPKRTFPSKKISIGGLMRIHNFFLTRFFFAILTTV